MKEKVPGKNFTAMYDDLNDNDLKTDDFFDMGEQKAEKNEN